MFSRLLTPKWLLLHVLVAVLFVATFFLGYWQLTKAEAGGGAVNWSYALQWPLYGFMGLWFYLRMVRIELHRDPDDGAPGATSSSTSALASTRLEILSWPPTTPTSPSSTSARSASGAAPVAADRTASARDSEQAIAAALQRYRVMANVVGVLLILLICVAVPLKYFGGMPRAGRRPRHRARLALRAVLPVRRRPGAAGEVDR